MNNGEPRPSQDVETPSAVLDELLQAFSGLGPGDDIDFDDPSIDRLLGLTPANPVQVIAADHPQLPSAASDPADPTSQVSDTDDSSVVDPALALDSPDEPPVPAAKSGAARVIVIGGSEQPDAVYLDTDPVVASRSDHAIEQGVERADVDRSTIVIGDIDDGVESVGEYTKSPSERANVEPRFRARRIAVRRAAGRKRLRRVAMIATIIIVLVGGFGVLVSNAFSATTIDIQGASYTDPAELAAIVDDLRGTPLLLIDELQTERRLEALAWVESAQVRTDFPNRVQIDIRERDPIAWYPGSDGRIRVIDRDSRVLSVIDGEPLAYARITSAGPDAEPGQFAGAPYATAAQYVIALPPEVRVMFTSMSIDPTTGDVTMTLNETVTVRLGDASSKQTKLVRLLQIVENGLDGIVAIDVTTDEPSITRG